MKLRFIGFLMFLSCLAALAADNVTVSENENSFTLDNGIIAARISKRSGDLISLTYKQLEMLDTGDRAGIGGYWSHDTMRGDRTNRITIDPKTNRGERGEVSIKGVSNGRQMGSGPGGSVVADIEIRYALDRGDSGIYTYSIFSHPTNYPATSVGEARFCAKLNDKVFDWMTVDSNRNMRVITAYDWDHGTVMNMKEARYMNSGDYKGQVEHKYDYSANQFNTLAWGWSSSAKNVGFWFVNPTTEYLSGGPTKVELSAHRDATFGHELDAPAPPCLLNYWRGSHYGGSICSVTNGEAWTKVIGPFLIYCNTAKDHNAMWQDALKRSRVESKAWPYGWVAGVDFPHSNERADVKGQLVLHDPQNPNLKMDHLLVGLSAPAYTWTPGASRFGRRGTNRPVEPPVDSDETPPTNNVATTDVATTNGPSRSGGQGRGRGFGGGFNFGPRTVDWQNDAKHYEFWVRGDAKGNFSISNVRPGKYTLHAIADGVLGEFVMSNVVVSSGQSLKLGKLAWQPVRYGKQLWDIGVPDRTADKFFKGDDYYHWGWYLEYPKLFPDDVNYVVGKSNYHIDWFFEQVPHAEDLGNTNGVGRGRSTTWSITFNLPQAPHGKATLRLAICGVGTTRLDVTVNDKPAGAVSGLFYNATINRDGIGGFWSEHDVAFDASLMKPGKNVMKLTIPPGGLTSGIMYDYLRLELDESAPPPAARVASTQ
jgi:rhamnogalacturonan endolyase